MKITKRSVDALRPAGMDYFEWDDTLPGFGIRVYPSGRKVYLVQKKRAYPRVQRRKSLGTHGVITPAQARAMAPVALIELAKEMAEGKSAADVRRAAKRAAEESKTYAKAVEEFVEKYHKGRKGNATWHQSERLLLRHGAGWLDRPIKNISKPDVIEVLDGLMAGGTPYLANRCFSAMGTFFRWLGGRDALVVNPMAGVDRPFDGETSRDRHFSQDEIKASWTASEQLSRVHGAFVRLLYLTGKRKGHLARMRWSEIDDEWVWTPPQPLTRKQGNKRNNPVPLSKLAQSIIEGLRDSGTKSSFVFAGRRPDGHMDPGTRLKHALRELSGIRDWHFHAVRHTVETELAVLKVPPHLRDLVLDHASVSRRGSGDRYDHHDYIPEMLDVFERWSDKVESLVVEKQVVTLPALQFATK